MDGDDGAKYRSCVNNMKIRYYKEEKERIGNLIKETKDYSLLTQVKKIDDALRSLRSGGEE
ncbi:MAG: hypothetical protein ACLUSP_02920 [Christensenellales bacterium]